MGLGFHLQFFQLTCGSLDGKFLGVKFLFSDFWVKRFFCLGFLGLRFLSEVSRSKDFPASGFWFLDFFGFRFNGLRFLGPWFIG